MLVAFKLPASLVLLPEHPQLALEIQSSQSRFTEDKEHCFSARTAGSWKPVGSSIAIFPSGSYKFHQMDYHRSAIMFIFIPMAI